MDFITKKLIETRLENLKEFDINDKHVKIKLDGIGERYGFPTPFNHYEILKFVSNNAMALLFVKDANKQNKHELWVFELLANHLKIEQLNKKSKSLINGDIVPFDNKSNNSAKTIDFIATHNNKTLVITHKYTQNIGGAQDNQYKDCKNFLIEAAKGALKNNMVYIALLDGNYYNSVDKHNISKIETLRLEFPHKNIIISPTELFISQLNDYQCLK